jgi:signal transduction histidine kinase
VVDADPKAFDRIVSNLVVNAIHYGRAPITIAARQRDHHFRLAVEDRGAGVPHEFVPHLFDRFSRGADGCGDGSGLGLSIAKSYAQAHGGELVYQSAHPHGARFELVLPRPHTGGPGLPPSA